MEFNLSNNITVTNQQSTIVTITTTGPQGPIGPIGNSGSDGAPGPPGSIDFDWYDGNSYISTSKDVYITGSLTVSGSNTFNNIGPANFTTISASSYISASEFSGDGTSLILKSGISWYENYGKWNKITFGCHDIWAFLVGNAFF